MKILCIEGAKKALEFSRSSVEIRKHSDNLFPTYNLIDGSMEMVVMKKISTAIKKEENK